jgi:hypothetical protein
MDNQAQVTNCVTVDDLIKQMAMLRQLREEEARWSAEKTAASARVEQAEKKMVELLELSGLKNFKGPDGTVYISYRTSVKTPKTPDDRAAFFEYLKSRGLYDQMITVNSQTLNSFYKSEIEEAQGRGQPDFEIPGLSEVTVEPRLGFRKA